MSHILVVEDEKDLAEGIAFNLRNAGYHVTLAPDGEQALDLLRHNTYDLVLLDLMLPGMDGLAVTEEARKAGIYSPIVMLTAKGHAEDVVRGLNAGADDYVTKPFDIDQLMARVRGFLRRQVWGRAGGGGAAAAGAGGAPAQPLLSFGKCWVNFTTYRALGADGSELELSAKEAKIMQVFAAREGAVITRGTLLQEVWGLPATFETRTVENFILRLRKYFEVTPSSPRHIVSVRGIGYRFER
ncbi:MAG: response regulator transcription factor [Planctomycetes bacterium]|nr:response regulator transcription factor [Planctomycetota bacterium]